VRFKVDFRPKISKKFSRPQNLSTGTTKAEIKFSAAPPCSAYSTPKTVAQKSPIASPCGARTDGSGSDKSNNGVRFSTKMGLILGAYGSLQELAVCGIACCAQKTF